MPTRIGNADSRSLQDVHAVKKRPQSSDVARVAHRRSYVYGENSVELKVRHERRRKSATDVLDVASASQMTEFNNAGVSCNEPQSSRDEPGKTRVLENR